MPKKRNDRYVLFRIINNNVVTSLDENNAEIVLMGKGISFHKKIGDYIDAESIEKIFVLKGQEKKRYLEVIEQISPQYFDMAMEILEMAEKQLQVKANPIGYVMLADHISSAVDRMNEHIILKNEMLNEIKHFHPAEYEIGKMALKQIKDAYDISLPIDEAGFIAYHIINLSEGGGVKQDDKRMKLVKKVLEIIENYFNIRMNQDSIYYERFITHLKYFGARVFSQDTNKMGNNDDFLYRMMKIQYPEITKVKRRGI